MTGSEALRKAAKEIESLCNQWDMAAVNRHKTSVNLDAVNSNADTAVKSLAAMRSELTAKPTVRHPSRVERNSAFATTLIRIGRNLRGGRVYSLDTFHERVIAESEPEYMEFVAGESPGMFAALISEYPEIAQVAEEAGVLAFTGDDNRVRIVNARWLTDESEIAKFVTDPAPIGKRCRFCAAVEPDDSMELHSLDSDQRGHHDVRVSGMEGRRQVVINSGYVYTHRPCADYWNQWVEIARKKYREAAA